MNKKEKELVTNSLTDKGIEKNLIEEYFDALEKYLGNKAKPFAKNNMAMIEDSTVFNWAYDFFHDEEYKNSKPSKVEKLDGDGNYTSVEETKEETPKELEPVFKRPKATKEKEAEGQISLW